MKKQNKKPIMIILNNTALILKKIC